MDLFFIFVMGTLLDTFIIFIFSVFFVILFVVILVVTVVDDAAVVLVDDAAVVLVDDATVVVVDDGTTVVDVAVAGFVTALRCLGFKASSLNADFLTCLFAVECEDELLPVISNARTSLPFRSIVILKH